MIAITPEVSVRYEILPADLEAILVENARRRRVGRLSLPLLLFAFTAGMLTFLCLYLIGGRGAMPSAIFGGALVCGCAIFWSPRRARQMALKRVAQRLTDPGNAFLLGSRTLELGAQGFSIQGPDSDMRFTWAALKRVHEMPERLLLYLTDFSAHPLPLNAADTQRVLVVIRKYAARATG